MAKKWIQTYELRTIKFHGKHMKFTLCIHFNSIAREKVVKLAIAGKTDAQILYKFLNPLVLETSTLDSYQTWQKTSLS